MYRDSFVWLSSSEIGPPRSCITHGSACISAKALRSLLRQVRKTSRSVLTISGILFMFDSIECSDKQRNSFISERSGLMRRRRLIVLFYGPLRPSPNRSSRHHRPQKLAWWAMAQSLQIDGENIRQAHTVNSLFSLRALAAEEMPRERKSCCCRTARKPVVHASRSENTRLKDHAS